MSKKSTAISTISSSSTNTDDNVFMEILALNNQLQTKKWGDVLLDEEEEYDRFFEEQQQLLATLTSSSSSTIPKTKENLPAITTNSLSTTHNEDANNSPTKYCKTHHISSSDTLSTTNSASISSPILPISLSGTSSISSSTNTSPIVSLSSTTTAASIGNNKPVQPISAKTVNNSKRARSIERPNTISNESVTSSTTTLGPSKHKEIVRYYIPKYIGGQGGKAGGYHAPVLPTTKLTSTNISSSTFTSPTNINTTNTLSSIQTPPFNLPTTKTNIPINDTLYNPDQALIANPTTIEDTLKLIITTLRESAEQNVLNSIKILGIPTVLQLFHKTIDIEKNGGMLTADNGRRRTPGGVFFYQIREYATKEQYKEIFAADNHAHTLARNARRKSIIHNPPSQNTSITH